MRRAFTLIEILAVIAVIAAMLSVGLANISAGKGAARVKGATRDVYAAIRHARSTALVTGQRVIVNYSNEMVDGEVMAKVEVVAAKIMGVDPDRPDPQPYYVMEYEDLHKRELVHISGAQAKPADGDAPGQPADESGGETLEEYLFSPMSAKVVSSMRLKVLKGDEALKDETAEQAKSRISVFSNVDYLMGRYQAARAAEAKKQEEDGQGSPSSSGSVAGGSVNDMNEPVSVVWQTNGTVEPHRVWVYADGEKPEDGLLLDIDRFGAIKVVDGEEEE